MASIFAFHMGKVIIDPEKGFKIILHAPMMIRQLQIHSTIDGGKRLHDLSPLKKSNHHRIDLWRVTFLAMYTHEIILLFFTSGDYGGKGKVTCRHLDLAPA